MMSSRDSRSRAEAEKEKKKEEELRRRIEDRKKTLDEIKTLPEWSEAQTKFKADLEGSVEARIEVLKKEQELTEADAELLRQPLRAYFTAKLLNAEIPESNPLKRQFQKATIAAQGDIYKVLGRIKIEKQFQKESQE
jgi:hypothetical protein